MNINAPQCAHGTLNPYGSFFMFAAASHMLLASIYLRHSRKFVLSVGGGYDGAAVWWGGWAPWLSGAGRGTVGGSENECHGWCSHAGTFFKLLICIPPSVPITLSIVRYFVLLGYRASLLP